ncbi:class I SAM-dependent methyltransferase [Rhizobium sp. P40RR-XXII]|uniref:class I SAM-dependent methyltransferase n=1 Tax=Rhizobium sp. P40RR-XXII TaxID=2726739 RepID=UPI001456652A|nr:class I SAM-dependent methyltransferase [Rhizobium sp. P40RR-XXII]NLS19912.1 class I SAM-dependent methyltransferase [Rhizobium sp. P40RR-XXII]
MNAEHDARLEDIKNKRSAKMAKLKNFLRDDMPCTVNDNVYNYLSKELRAMSGIVDTNAVSSMGYDHHGLNLVEKYKDGLVLDCGAGRRDIYFDNVVNFEIVDYDSTDVVGVGEELPFKDNTFDAIISIAVLEHVKYPFRCAAEIMRVLKPGGELYCAVPFLQPLHGYPHHYYNMSHQGLRSLFDPLEVIEQDVLDSTSPIFSLTWILERWAKQLPDEDRAAFENLKVKDLIDSPWNLRDKPWAANLPKAAQFELASATILRARKPE